MTSLFCCAIMGSLELWEMAVSILVSSRCRPVKRLLTGRVMIQCTFFAASFRPAIVNTKRIISLDMGKPTSGVFEDFVIPPSEFANQLINFVIIAFENDKDLLVAQVGVLSHGQLKVWDELEKGQDLTLRVKHLADILARCIVAPNIRENRRWVIHLRKRTQNSRRSRKRLRRLSRIAKRTR